MTDEKKAKLEKKEKEEAAKRERKEKAFQNKLAKVQALQGKLAKNPTQTNMTDSEK